MGKSHLRLVPSVEKVLSSDWAEALAAKAGRARLAEAVRSGLEALRAELLDIRDGEAAKARVSPEAVEGRVRSVLASMLRPAVRRAINATGILLHTALGRAPLADAAREAVRSVYGYAMLELDEETGKRGERHAAVCGLLARLTGAEAAHVVVNNAAATLLAIRTLAAGREVIVSRGQLVEIGGSFRMPEVMAESGAIMREVGTTNRTHVADYEAAITERTALLLHVHTSNYRVVGFTESVPVGELVELGRKAGIPVMDDIGSGCLVDLSRYGLPREPTAQESIRAGADVVTFSTDKMLGGPQGGALVGRSAVIERVRRHPLARALRVGKTTLAALEATLRLYGEPEELGRTVPLYRMLSTPVEKLDERAGALAAALAEHLPGLRAEVIETEAEMGSGSLPAHPIPSRGVRLSGAFSVEEAARRLRAQEPAVVCRIKDDALVFDVRTLTDEEAAELVALASAAVGSLSGSA